MKHNHYHLSTTVGKAHVELIAAQLSAHLYPHNYIWLPNKLLAPKFEVHCLL